MSRTGLLIRGTVHDQAGKPVPAARVWIAAAPVPVPEIASLTDDDGGFLIAVPTPGPYEIAATADGFASERKLVDVSNEGADVAFRFVPSM